jgi:hypothetical protein
MKKRRGYVTKWYALLKFHHWTCIWSSSDIHGTLPLYLGWLRCVWDAFRHLERLRHTEDAFVPSEGAQMRMIHITPSGGAKARMPERVHAVWKGPDASGTLFHHLE